jgi:phosphoribosylamine---glycine ligase
VKVESPRRVLILGSGAREHALARALVRGDEEREVIVAPGNGGIAGARLSRRAIPLSDPSAVVELARSERVDLVVVGPEQPLADGIVDALDAAGIATFGPSRAAARLEGSKAFLKELATRAGIPTAAFDVCTTVAEAERAIDARSGRCVVKADGLCAGKGVIVASDRDEAIAAAREMLEARCFGEAGATIIVEDRLEGREVSVHAICDGTRWVTLPPARDHKRALDGDQGPNTGGMGVICPTPDVDAALLTRIDREIVAPTLRQMATEGAPFRGVLFAGLMITPEGEPMLLEHNVRFGDPECEALMALTEGDVGVWLLAAARGALDPATVRFDAQQHAVVVVMAAEGYPTSPRTGDAIEGIEGAESLEGVLVNHAGTRLDGERLLTSGGRVLAVTARSSSLEAARRRAYEAVARVRFDGSQYRSDIGASTLGPV